MNKCIVTRFDATSSGLCTPTQKPNRMHMHGGLCHPKEQQRQNHHHVGDICCQAAATCIAKLGTGILPVFAFEISNDLQPAPYRPMLGGLSIKKSRGPRTV